MNLTSPLEVPPPQPAKRRYTYQDMVAEMPETAQPYELWDGELVTSPTPSVYHQQIVLRFYEQLARFVREKQLGVVLTAPLDMVLSPHRVAQPDVMFIANQRLEIIQRVITGPADLVVEVISLGGWQRDRIDKKDLYEQYGIKEYWIIDPEPRTIDVLHLARGRYELVQRSGPGQTAGSRLLEGLKITVDELFINPLGEL